MRLLFCLMLAAVAAPAQTKPTFEVASIKPTAWDMEKLAAQVQNGEMPRVGPRVDGARAEYTFLTLKDLVTLAYKVKPFQITGPDWIGNQRFDIVAKLPEGASKDDAPMMLQALLEERFQLKLHRESKERPVLALLLGKDGSKMKESTETPKPIDPDAPLAPGERKLDGPDGPIRMKLDTRTGSATMNMGAKGTLSYSVDPATRSMKIEASHVTMEGFADMLTSLSQASGGQQVKDMTGLKGNYQIAISFQLEDLINLARAQGAAVPNTSESAAGRPADAASTPGGTSTLHQAVQAMGLKLESRKSVLEQLVIDHIEKAPTEN